MNEELDRERETLARAERDLSEGQARLDRQLATVAEARSRGRDTRQGERLSAVMRTTLDEWQRHHSLILARIAHLEAEERRTEHRC